MLIRRHPGHGELAYFRCYGSPPGRASRAGPRRRSSWSVEESFQAGKGLTGLDEHPVRRRTSWRRWTLVAMLAHALLAVLAATERAHHQAPSGLIEQTCNEIHKLLDRLIIDPTRRLINPLTCTDWRRRHQHRARTSHYRTRPET